VPASSILATPLLATCEARIYKEVCFASNRLCYQAESSPAISFAAADARGEGLVTNRTSLDGKGTEFIYDDLGNLLNRQEREFVGGAPVGSAIRSTTFTIGDGTISPTTGRRRGIHQMMSSSYGAFAYDVTGNQTAAPGRTVDYTKFNLPRTVHTNGGNAQFLYDANHVRVWRDGAEGSIVTLDGLYERRPAGGQIEHNMYVQGEGRPVAVITWGESGGVVMSENTRFLGHVVGVNVPMQNLAGQLVTDADILLRNAVVQVKSGSGTGLTSQLVRTQSVTSLPVIGYGPTLGGALVRGIQRAGGLVTRDRQLLIRIVVP
jgi:hypothetical protein